MSSQRTAEEVDARLVAAMGKRLGTIYYRLWNECAWLHWKWREYETLYGTNSSRIELLNHAAPGFFRIVQDTLWEDVLLHIARLTDPPKVASRETLTLRALPPLVDAAVRSHVGEALDVAFEICVRP